MEFSNEEKIIKQKIQDIFTERAKGNIFCSKARWYTEDEKCSRYYFSLEKARYKQRMMARLVKSDGTISRKQKELLKMQCDFYRKLPTSDPDILFTFHQNHNMGKKLSNEERDFNDRPVTLEELTIIMKKSKQNRTPGCDGQGIELYEILWDELGHLLHKALLYAFEMNQLHLSARRGIISFRQRYYSTKKLAPFNPFKYRL